MREFSKGTQKDGKRHRRTRTDDNNYVSRVRPFLPTSEPVNTMHQDSGLRTTAAEVVQEMARGWGRSDFGGSLSRARAARAPSDSKSAGRTPSSYGTGHTSTRNGVVGLTTEASTLRQCLAIILMLAAPPDPGTCLLRGLQAEQEQR